MRILLVTPMPPRREAPGAIPVVLHAQLAGLRARHDVTLVTVVGDEPGEVEAAEEVRRSGIDVHVVDRRQPQGIARWRRRFRLASTWARGRYPWRTIWFAEPSVQAKLDQLTRDRRFDVVAVEDNSMALFQLPPQLPSVLTEHEVHRPGAMDRPRERRRDWLGWAFGEIDRRRWSSYQRSVWRRFDRVQVFTERDATGIAELAPDIRDRVRINPFGIDLPKRADPAREEQGCILFVGNFTHPPNVDSALWLAGEIMPRLRASTRGVRLLLVGGGAPREVQDLAGADIEVLGEVPEVSRYVERAAVVVAPVRTGGGMRMKVLYALASGKAVVTTPLGLEGLVFGGNEPPLAVAEDAEQVATMIETLLQDYALRVKLGDRARTFVAEHYSAEAYGRRLEAVYAEVAAICRESRIRAGAER